MSRSTRHQRLQVGSGRGTVVAPVPAFHVIYDTTVQEGSDFSQVSTISLVPSWLLGKADQAGERKTQNQAVNRADKD